MSSNIVALLINKVHSFVLFAKKEVIGSHQSLMMVDNYSTGSQYNGTPPAEGNLLI